MSPLHYEATQAVTQQKLLVGIWRVSGRTWSQNLARAKWLQVCGRTYRMCKFKCKLASSLVAEA
eukprot:944732-Pelagomonas_calceolata.AAC.1